jgi:hypothetical protein
MPAGRSSVAVASLVVVVSFVTHQASGRRLQPRRRLGAAAAGHRHRPEPAPALTKAAPPVGWASVRCVLGCRGEAQIAEERSDEGGGLRFGRGPAATEATCSGDRSWVKTTKNRNTARFAEQSSRGLRGAVRRWLASR